jgi:hypothetical protein
MFRMRCHCQATVQYVECNKWVNSDDQYKNTLKSCNGACPKLVNILCINLDKKKSSRIFIEKFRLKFSKQLNRLLKYFSIVKILDKRGSRRASADVNAWKKVHYGYSCI